MRRNHILALLATGALPLSAFAAIDIPGVATDKESWDLSGVSNVQTDADGIITVPGAQGGYPVCTIDKLPAGEYTIKADLDNAKLVVLLDGAEVDVDAAGVFTTTKEGQLVIEVRAVDMSASYSFGNVTLALNVDLEAIYNGLVALMPTNPLTEPSQYMAAYNTDEITGANVIAEYNSLKDHTALDAAIAAVNPEGKTPEQQLEAYLTYKNNGVQAEVESYAEAVDAYENGVKNDDDEWEKYPIDMINGWADTLHDNIVAHNDDLNKVNSKNIENPGYQKQLDTVKETIDSTGDTEALATEIAAADQAIADALAQIAANWAAEGVQVGKADYQTVDFTAVKDAIKALKEAYSQLLNDQDRYTNLWLPDYEKLTNAYINAQQEIKALYEGEPGQKERQDSVMLAVTEIYNNAVSELQVTLGDGVCSADQYTHDDAIIEAAIEALEARTAADDQNLKDEKAALQAGTDLVDGLGSALDEIDIHDDAYKKADLDDKSEELKAAIEALQAELDRIYASTEVLSDEYVNGDFNDKVEALQAQIDDFAAQVAVANQLGALTTALEAARADLAADENNVYLKGLDKEYAVDVVDIMKGSYDNIQDAIEQQQGIYDEDYKNVETSALDDILASINGDDDSYLTNGKQMAQDFADAYKIAIPDLQNAIALVDYLNNNDPAFNVAVTSTLEGVGVDKVNDVDQKPFKDTANEYKTTAQEIIDAIKAARTLTPQNAFDAIEAVMDEITAANLAENIPATKIDFLKAVIGSEDAMSNIQELHFALEYIEDEMADITDYAGYDKVEELYNEALAALDGVDADFAAGVTAEDFEAVNAAAKNIRPSLQAVQNEIDKVVKNYDSWQRVLALVDEIEGKKADAIAFAEEHAYQPAQDTWIQMVEDKVQEAIDLKNGDVQDTYEAVEMLSKEAAFTQQLNDILAWFAGYEDAVMKNEIAHNALLDESGSITTLVDEVNTTIENAEVPIILEDGSNAADVLKGYIDELSALDTELYNTYKDVSCDGQEQITGSEEDPTLMDKYEDLRGKINDLRATLDDDYAKALKEYNEQFIADNWNAFRTDVMDVYTHAIFNLDEFQAAVQTCAALAENEDIQDGVDHQPIYEFAPEIQQLLSEVVTMLENSWPSKINGEANPNQHKLTEDDLADFIARANDIIDSIGDIYSEKVEKIVSTAESVLADKQGAVETLINDVKAELAAAGCDDESIAACVKDAEDALDQAEQLAQTPLGGPEQPAYITNIGSAINLLDGVDITDEQKVAAAQSTFNNAVAAVEDAIAAAQATLDESTLPESKKNEFQSQLDAATQELNSYKNDEITLENLIDELAKVNGIDVASIQAAIDQAIEDNQANNDNKNALDGKVGDLQDSLDALNDWVEQLLVAADVPTTTLQAQVTAVQDAINAAYNAEELSDDAKVADLEAQIAAVQAAIDEAYAEAYKLEIKRLNEELFEANRAYNEAAKKWEAETGVADYPDTDEGKEYTAKIDEQALALGVAAAKPEGFVPDEAAQQAVLDIQDALLQIQIDLGYLSAADVVASLNEAAENAIKTINDSKDALGNYAAEEYADAYDALVAEVEALQQKWTENEATVIVQEGVYLRDINEIVNTKLAELDAEAAAYQAEREANAAHEAASDAAYETLNGDLDAVREAYNAAAANAEAYADRIHESVASALTGIEGTIADDQDALDAAKADFECATFEWPTALETIQGNIDLQNKIIWSDVTTSYQGEAQQAIANAKAALNNGSNHQGASSYEAALRSLQTQLDKLAVVTDGDAEAGEAYVAAAKEIIEKAEALFSSIVEDEFTPGDINGSGDVTTSDYQDLIDLLGQIEDPTDFDNPAYDVNGDGQVTMADIASIIDILMGRTSDADVMARMPMVNTNNAVFVVKTGVNNGVTRYAVMLNNTADLFGAQMDITLSDGMEIVTEGVAERTSNHEFYGSTTYSGNHRVILSSINKSTFVGSEGAVVYFDVRGEGELNVNNVLGVDAQGRMYMINVMSNVTGIESISNDAKNADIYNVGGQKLNRMERGVNIIRTEDGKASKVLNK